jgi:hypothetical protein
MTGPPIVHTSRGQCCSNPSLRARITTGKCSHKIINDAANERRNFEKAHDYTSNRQRTGARTYPKASSGFRPTEHAHDPAHGFDQAYHYPMIGIPGPAHRNPVSGHVSVKAGSERIVAWKNKADPHYNIGVSYHDPSRPIPNESSKNHPFTHARVKSVGPMKINLKAALAKKAIQRKWRKVISKPKH